MSRSSLGEWASQRVGAAIRELLETKHLYQSLSLDETRIVAEAAEAGFAAEEQAKIVAALKGEWVALDEITVQRVVAPSSWDMFDAPPPQVCFMVISIKAACAECRGVTPFNLVRPIDLFGGDRSW